MEERIRKVLAQLDRGVIIPSEFNHLVVVIVMDWLKAYGEEPADA